MSSDTAGFNLLVSVSQDCINYQMAQLFKQGVIHPRLTIQMADTGIAIDAALSAPTIDFAVAGSMTAAILKINMPSGSFTYYDGFGPSAKQHVINFSNWVYAFDVNLNLQQIAKSTLDGSGVVPPVVKALLQGFTDDQFTIQHLFMDFQNADIARYDPVRTKMPMPDGSTITPGQLTQWQNAIENYFTSLAGQANPYILGYTVAAHDAHAGAGEIALFNPTGATFSTYQGGQASWQNCLNFLLMTNNAALLAVPPNGVISASPIASIDHDGAMCVDAGVFVTGYLEAQVLPTLAQAAGVGTFTRLGNAWVSASTANNLDQGGGRGPVVGSDSHILDIHLEQTTTKNVTVTLVTGAKPTIHVAGSYVIDNGYYEYPFNARTWDGTVTSSLAWTLDLVLGAGVDGKLTVTPTFNAPPPTQVQDENFIQKIADFLGGQGVGAYLTQLGNYATQLEQNSFSWMQSSLSSALAHVGQRVVLPAGEVFFFSDATMLDDFGMRFDIQYQAAH